MKLLQIIASPRGEKSRTLNVSNEFLKSLKAKNPNLVVDELDLFKEKLPEFLGGEADSKYTLLGGGTLKEESKTSWDKITKYSRDFLSYDVYLISNPMWNFTIPYKLKHYIDLIMQAGILFRFTENGVEGLALNKKMYCITSRGNNYSEGSQMHQFDFQEPYLRSIFGLAGIVDITFINAQPMDFTPELTQMSLNKSVEEAKLLAQDFVI
jgi:FMN-dependent NADH-azoreductase